MFKYFKNGFLFECDDQLSEFRFRLFSTVLIIAAVFAPLFSGLHYLGLIDLSDFQAHLNLVYGVFSLMIWFEFRRFHENYFLFTLSFISFSFFVYLSAFLFSVHDDFRAIWFYILVAMTFVLLPRKWGELLAVLSMFGLMMAYQFGDIVLKQDAMISVIIAMIPFALILRAYAKQGEQQVIELSEKNAKLAELATKDELTQSFNRHMFYELGEQLFAMAKRQEQSLSILMLELDHFKLINGSYGRLVSDDVLCQFSQWCLSSKRESDVFARIGDEGFGLILPSTDLSGAIVMADRLLKSLNTTPCRIKARDICVTVTIGVSQMMDGDNGLEMICLRADQALNNAKVAGRNQVKVL